MKNNKLIKQGSFASIKRKSYNNISIIDVMRSSDEYKITIDFVDVSFSENQGTSSEFICSSLEIVKKQVRLLK